MNKIPSKKEGFVFKRENYIILLAGILTSVVGYLLMIGGGSEDPTVFSEELFSTRRITVAPIMVLAGFALVIYAIMKKPKKTTS